MEQREYLKQIHSNVIYKVISKDAMFNFTGTLAPLQYLSTSYDTGKNHVYYKGGSKPQYTIMMSLQRSGRYVD